MAEERRSAFVSRTVSTSKRAGRASGDLAARKRQNVNVAHGTVRRGAKGKGLNVYDARTATWKRGTTKTVSTKSPTIPKITTKATQPSANPYASYVPMQSPKTSWGTAKTSSESTLEKHQRLTRARDRQLTALGVVGAVAGNPFPLLKTTRGRAIQRNVVSGVKSAVSSVERWWQGY